MALHCTLGWAPTPLQRGLPWVGLLACLAGVLCRAFRGQTRQAQSRRRVFGQGCDFAATGPKGSAPVTLIEKMAPPRLCQCK